jgi:ribosomal protein S18 acetylase RimI-like enzyme
MPAMSFRPAPTVRRDLRPGDLGAIVAHHGRTYLPEYGLSSEFEAHVCASVAEAGKRGFPRPSERLWIVEVDGRHAGSVALTNEGDGLGAVRWVVLDRELRGDGLGRRLISELVAEAEQLGYAGLWLETFSELEAAAAIYTSLGFELVSEETGPRWGRERISYRRYELDLQDRAQSSSPESTGSSARPFSLRA